MSVLEHLNKINSLHVYSVFDEEFKTYGRVLSGYDFSPLINYMESQTMIPDDGNIYVASVPELEDFEIAKVIESDIYGNLPIQIGYCNGKNSTYNGFEYHKCSELNIAVTDFVLALGHSYDIKDNHYHNEDAELFYVPKGVAVEMYQTTLHLSPLKVNENGFKNIVVLLKGTNTPLNNKGVSEGNGERRLLLQKNKWVLAHPEREPLISQGAYPGIIGPNTKLLF